MPSAANNTKSLVLDGVSITHPDRVISDVGHVLKKEVAEYYATMAPWILPAIERHPLSLLRCPSGIKKCFYQRNPGKGLGSDVHPFEFEYQGSTHEYLYIEDEKGLLELVQMNVIEIHPWGARIDTVDYPDRLVFDLDPATGVSLESLKTAAKDLRQRLQEKGLESNLKTTGGNGLHVIVPLASKDRWDAVKRFAGGIAKDMVEAEPEAYVATMSKAKRAGKIFVDYFRNDYTATSIADYAVRARPGAPVAVPLEWSELEALQSPAQFHMKDVLKRMSRRRPQHRREREQRLPNL